MSPKKKHEHSAPDEGWFALPPCPGAVDHELIWGLVALSLLAAGWALPFWQGLVIFNCPFHQITGYPCFMCGGTRAFGLLTRGHWLAAWRMNPLAAALGLSAALYGAYASFAILFARRLCLPALAHPWLLRLLALAGLCVIAANWIYLIRAGR